MAWRALLDKKCIISSFSQLDEKAQLAAHRFLKTEFEAAQAHATGTEEESEVDRFADFVRKHPGELYKADRKLHRSLLVQAMFSSKYAVMKRSTVEAFTRHR